MDDYLAILSACLAVIVAICIVRWYNDPLRAIPTVGGSSLPVLSYLGAWRMRGDCRDVLEEAYRKYAGSAFKIAYLDRWMVVVSGRNMVEEIRKRADELSGAHAIQEAMQMRYLFEPSILADEYHVTAVKEMLVRKRSTILRGVIDEVAVAVGDHTVADENEWSSVEVMPAMRKIVARASNRAIVGLPLCRDEDYLALVFNFAAGFMKSTFILRFFPRFLKPIVALFVNVLKQDTYRAVSYLLPIIEERQRAVVELGEGWNEKPNDLLQSFLDKATAKNEPIFTVVQRLLLISFVSIDSTSMTATHALYHLAEKQEIVGPLRDEIEANVASDGWTSTALGKMWKLDSLLREILRFHGVGLLSMGRIAVKDITLSDGTRIPEGTLLTAQAYAMHHDGALCDNARTFDPFRFARMRPIAGSGSDGQSANAKCLFTTTSAEYIPFGYGQYSWCVSSLGFGRGEILCVERLKAILACIILNYDMKLGGDGSRPPGVYTATSIMPAPHGRILFKKRGGSV